VIRGEDHRDLAAFEPQVASAAQAAVLRHHEVMLEHLRQ
jgi:hypothetical protein